MKQHAAITDSVVNVARLLSGAAERVEARFIYYPERTLTCSPGDAGMQFHEFEMTADDATRLHGWLLPGRAPWAVLWLHGNAGNICSVLPNVAAFKTIVDATILVFDYRGYGRSEGTPTERGLYRDARAALSTLENATDHPLVLVGQSLGSAIAVEVATRARPAGVILEGAFTSVADMTRTTYPLLVGARLLMRSRYDSLSKIGRVAAPLLILHGREDEVVPYTMAQRLFARARQPKRLVLLDHVGHDEAYELAQPEYENAVRSFFAQLGA